MGLRYAGILGPLAVVTVLVRGLLAGESVDATLLHAWLSLLVFAALGSVAGWIADRTLVEATQAQVAAELAELKRQQD